MRLLITIFFAVLLLSLGYQHAFARKKHPSKAESTGQMVIRLDSALTKIREGNYRFKTVDFISEMSNADSSFEQVYNKAVFLNAMDFTGATFNKSIELSYASFRDSVDFFEAQFNNTVSFSTDTFVKKASFSNIQFHFPCDFSFSQIYSYIDFSNDSFYSGNFNSIFCRDTADYSGCVFQKTSYFYYDTFQNFVNFQRTIFDSAYFAFSGFQKQASFSADSFRHFATFCGAALSNADFTHAYFGNVLFDSAAFSSPAHFNNAYFNNSADFNSAVFYSNVNYASSTFRGSANFTKAKFLSFADFSYGHFDSLINFQFAQFSKYLDLSFLNSASKLKIDFRQSSLPEVIDFSNNPDLKCKVDFINASFVASADSSVDRSHYINLFKSDIANVNLDYKHFKLCFFDDENDDPAIGKLTSRFSFPLNDSQVKYLMSDNCFKAYLKEVFPGKKYVADSARWYFVQYYRQFKFPRRLTDDEKSSIYQRVLKSLDEQGLKESYKTLDIEYQQFKDPSRFHWRSQLNRIWWNFGYDKQYIFGHALLFLVIFSIITFCIFNFLTEEVYGFDDLAFYPIIRWTQPKASQKEHELRKNIYSVRARNARELDAVFDLQGVDIEVEKQQAPAETGLTEERSLSWQQKLGYIVLLLSLILVEPWLLLLSPIHIFLVFLGFLGAVMILSWIYWRAHESNRYTFGAFLQAVYIRLWFSLIYTSTIFLPLFLKVEKVKYKHMMEVAYVFIVYTTGIICVAYLANFVIQK